MIYVAIFVLMAGNLISTFNNCNGFVGNMIRLNRDKAMLHLIGLSLNVVAINVLFTAFIFALKGI